MTQSQIKRICSVCGIEKPIVAFLQITGKHGTTYGSICASCRATGQGTNKNSSLSDEDTTTTTEKRIGAKEKVYIEQKKSDQFKDLKDLYNKEAKKRIENITNKLEETDLKEKAEKDHRKFYLESKQKQGFLSQRRFGDSNSAIENIIEQNTKQLENIRNQADKVEIKKQEDIIRQEFQITSLDFSIPFIAGQTNQLRFQTDTFLKFKAWLGAGSPLLKTLDLLYQKNTEPTKAVSEHKTSNPKEEVEHYVEKRLDNPSGTRRR